MTAFCITDDLVEMQDFGVSIQRPVIHIVAEFSLQPRIIAVVLGIFVDGGGDVANRVTIIASHLTDIQISSIREPDLLIVLNFPKVAVKLACWIFVELGSLRLLELKDRNSPCNLVLIDLSKCNDVWTLVAARVRGLILWFF